ncbi:unnamed protein product [Camellia sinensis]
MRDERQTTPELDGQSLAAASVLPAMEKVEKLVVTTASGGGSLTPMRINYAKITSFDLIYNPNIAVHGVLMPFTHVNQTDGEDSKWIRGCERDDLGSEVAAKSGICQIDTPSMKIELTVENEDHRGLSSHSRSVRMLEKMDTKFDPEEVIEEFEMLTKDAERVQKETLQKILEENGSIEYLKKWGLNGRTDHESFKAFVPLVTHKDLEPYIQRMVDGDTSLILTGKPITTISLSSGITQGKPKFVPFNNELMESTMQIYKTSFAFRNREFPIGNGKALQFIYNSKQFKTKEGLAAGTATTSVFIWEELCTDIREGVLTSQITVPSIRTAMSKLLKPNPELADKIHKKCSGLSNWYGLISELFPNAKYIYGIMTGSMEPYLKKLRHYTGELPLLSADYGSSEGWIGANVNPKLPPELAIFAVLPNIRYFEFIPNVEVPKQDEIESSFLSIEPKTVGLTEVKIGEEYEIILTTFAV